MSTYWNFEKPVYENKRYVADYAFTMPEDCSRYAENNIENYGSISSLPEKYFTADYSNVINGTSIFQGCKNITEFPSFTAEKIRTLSACLYISKISKIPKLKIPHCADIGNSFSNTPNLKIAELKNIESDILEGMYNILCNDYNLVSIISMPNTHHTRNFQTFAQNTPNLVEVCEIDTSSATSLGNMFNYSGISGFDWEFNLQCAINVENMFVSCNNLLDKGITLINVPRTLDLSTIGCATSKYTVKNYIETALDPSEVVD